MSSLFPPDPGTIQCGSAALPANVRAFVFLTSDLLHLSRVLGSSACPLIKNTTTKLPMEERGDALACPLIKSAALFEQRSMLAYMQSMVHISSGMRS
jgi:hypothetical protein